MRLRSLALALVVSVLALPTLASPPPSPGRSGLDELEDRIAQLEQQLEALQDQMDVHAANASAHHARYADAEAVTAVGPHFSGNHADLSNVTPDQHHAPFSGSHADLTNVTPDQHHAPFSGSHDDLTGVRADQHHAPEAGGPEGAWRFVGVSTGTARGDDGSAQLDYLCSETFPGSRMATSAEFLTTPNKPYWSSGPAWIRPIPAVRPDTSSFDTVTGTEFPAGTGYGTCDGWNNTTGSSYGLRVEGAGRFVILSCDTVLRVACALPATTP